MLNKIQKELLPILLSMPRLPRLNNPNQPQPLSPFPRSHDFLILGPLFLQVWQQQLVTRILQRHSFREFWEWNYPPPLSTLSLQSPAWLFQLFLPCLNSYLFRTGFLILKQESDSFLEGFYVVLDFLGTLSLLLLLWLANCLVFTGRVNHSNIYLMWNKF